MSDLPANIEVQDSDWIAGNDPEKTSYCSPWVVATIKHDAVLGAQGYVTEGFVRRIAQQSSEFLMGDVAI